MKKRVKSKTKTSKRSTKNLAVPEPELPDLVAVMMKIAERLEALEKKMDRVVSQTSFRPPETRQGSPSVQSPEPFQHSYPGANPPHQVFPQNHGRSDRVLYQAVCADCHEDCEVPFKPAGERPVYCKECFAKRKGGGNSQKPNAQSNPVPIQQAQGKIISKGAGKAAVAAVVTSLPHAKRKHSKSTKKPKR